MEPNLMKKFKALLVAAKTEAANFRKLLVTTFIEK